MGSRLEEASWLPYAKPLVSGQRKYVDHNCGGGKTLVVSADDAGWSAHCFRCGANGFVPYGIRPIADLSIITKAEGEWASLPAPSLPMDFTHEIPPEYATWLYKNGISNRRSVQYNIGWSKKMQRIILPVYNESQELIFLQARAVESWRKPKYLNLSAVPKTHVLFRSRDWNGVRTCCVTEDIASTVRVGLHIPSVSTLGTSMSMEQASQINENFDRVYIWYDSDDAGKEGTRKALSILRMLNLSCYFISTFKDPKLYSDREIRYILTTGKEPKNVKQSRYPKCAEEANEIHEKELAYFKPFTVQEK